MNEQQKQNELTAAFRRQVLHALEGIINGSTSISDSDEFTLRRAAKFLAHDAQAVEAIETLEWLAREGHGPGFTQQDVRAGMRAAMGTGPDAVSFRGAIIALGKTVIDGHEQRLPEDVRPDLKTWLTLRSKITESDVQTSPSLSGGKYREPKPAASLFHCQHCRDTGKVFQRCIVDGITQFHAVSCRCVAPLWDQPGQTVEQAARALSAVDGFSVARWHAALRPVPVERSALDSVRGWFAALWAAVERLRAYNARQRHVPCEWCGDQHGGCVECNGR